MKLHEGNEELEGLNELIIYHVAVLLFLGGIPANPDVNHTSFFPAIRVEKRAPPGSMVDLVIDQCQTM